jgi:hypothetical protein
MPLYRTHIMKSVCQLHIEHPVVFHFRKAKEVIVDTTVQEKNVTFPTDAKLYKKVITKCNRIAKSCGIELRQSYRFVVQRLHYAQRYAHLARHAQQAKRALKKLSTLAGRQVRDLHKQLIKLGKEELYAPILQIMARIISQQRGDKNKVYNLHAPETSCIAKGKVHKKRDCCKSICRFKVSVAEPVGSGKRAVTVPALLRHSLQTYTRMPIKISQP